MTKGFSNVFLLRRNRLGVVMTLIILMELFLSIHDTQAYVLNGSRWPGQPTSGCCANIHYIINSGSTSISFGAWHAAESAWNGSTANVLFHEDTLSSGTNISLNDYIIADGTCAYVQSEGTDFTYPRGYINKYYIYTFSGSKLQACTAHEFGHLLGLDHTPGAACSYGLMYPAPAPQYDVCYMNTPQYDDINGVNAQY